MNKYELIFEAVQNALNNNDISLEEAEALNDYAYDRYITEDGHSKKLKARHNAKKKNMEKRFYDNMNFKYDHTDEKGNKHGTVQRGDGPETHLVIHKKNPGFDASVLRTVKPDGTYSSNIDMRRRDVRQKGSDLAGSHEYSHVIDISKSKVKNTDKLDKLNKKRSDILTTNTSTSKWLKKMKKSEDKIDRLGDKSYKHSLKDTDKETGFDKLSEEARRKFKSHDSHDTQSNEMRADYYAVTTTKGENNTNRLKKYLNEYSRRNNQKTNDKIDNAADLYKDLSTQLSKKKDLKSRIAKHLTSYASKKLLSDKQRRIDNEIKIHETRKNVNDYILKKKQEEKNKEE